MKILKRKVDESYNEELGLYKYQYEIKDNVLYSNYSLPNSKYLNKFKAVQLGQYYDSKRYRKFIDNNKNIDIYFEFPIMIIPNEEKSFLYSKEDDWNNVYFVHDDKKYSIKEMKKIDNTIDLMIKDIKDSNLSNYEKYLCAYDIVKSFKTYKQIDEDKTKLYNNDEIILSARSIYDVLLSEYVVCMGYAIFLDELLNRMNIISDVVCTDNHALVITYIKDDKYNIDSFQVSDPTYDSINDKYNNDPLLEKYYRCNLTVVDALKIYDIKMMKIFFEENVEKMEDILNKNCIDSMFLFYGPKKIFKYLMSIFGKKEFNKNDTSNFIKYIQDRVNVKIKIEDELKAIYNVYKFILNDNNVNYFDLIVLKFNLHVQYNIDKVSKDCDVDVYTLRSVNLLTTSMDIIISDIKKSYEMCNVTFSMGIEGFVIDSLLYEKELYNDGFFIYGDKILLSNNLVKDNCDIIKFDNELNNYYIDIDDNIKSMTYEEFRMYLGELLNSKKNRLK